MKVAIIGAGFAGLSTAYYLSKAGVDVTVFEKDEKPGGLAIGFKEDNWHWTLEKHYHHWFTNDNSILGLAKEIDHKVITVRPKTSLYYGGGSYQLDSPMSLLSFPHISLLDRVRTGYTLFMIKYILPWKHLENITAEKFIKSWMGDRSWEVLWEPLFNGKFHKYSDEISAAWFWSRIKKRTTSLSYPEGGYQSFAEKLEKTAKDQGVTFTYGVEVKEIKKYKNKFKIKANNKELEFDKVVCTLPSELFVKMTKELPRRYIDRLSNLTYIDALNVVLRIKRPFHKDGSYWLSINEREMPFIAVVEHTNFMDKSHFDNEHILYVGNYLPAGHKYFDSSLEELIDLFLPDLRKLNGDFCKKDIIKGYKFPGKFAQPIFPLGYSKILPDFTTPIDGLYLNNMQQVYPWDRGTNYSVENSKAVAQLVIGE